MVRLRKVAILGFPAVGKTSLVAQLSEKKFDEGYAPTIENHVQAKIVIRGQEFELDMLDTMGVTEQPSFPDDYLLVDGWTVVYSVANKRSFEVVHEILEKILHFLGAQKVPIVIVGNKTDLVSQRQVSTDEGKALAAQYKVGFLECSARDFNSVNGVFKTLIEQIEVKAGNTPAGKDDKECTIL